MVNVRNENRPEILKQIVELQEREVERLKSKVRALATELADIKGDPTVLQRELMKLHELLERREHALFGASSERRNAAPTDASEKPKHQGHGRKAQPALPVITATWELDDADKKCTACGGALAAWEGQFEESEEIDVVERRFVVTKHQRQKYHCQCGGCVETALGPPKLREGSRYSIDFAVSVAVGKYLDHLPLERQVRIMRREGLAVDSQTLWDQIEGMTRYLQPLVRRFKTHALKSEVLGADETAWPLLVDKKRPEAGKWYVWSVCTPEVVVHEILQSRSTESALTLLEDYAGVVLSDGYAAYASAQKQRRFVQAHCWAHVRREFLAAEKFYQRESKAVLDLIDEIFRIEREVPTTGPPAELRALRARLRDERSRWVVKALECWGMEIAARFIPESALGKAAAYMSKLWAGLVRFVDDARVPVDNNATERALRGIVVGRKNHYGSKSKRGTEVAAVLYSIIETCKLVGIDPKDYLRAAIHAAIRGEEHPLPHEVAEQASSTVTTAA